MPKHICNRCKSGKASNVTITVQGRSYRLCEKCFREYLTVDAADDRKQIEFVRKGPLDSFLGKLWYWIKRTARALIQQ